MYLNDVILVNHVVAPEEVLVAMFADVLLLRHLHVFVLCKVWLHCGQ